MSCNTCDENWLVESCDLDTGLVRNVLQPLDMRFDIGLNQFTDGALTLATRDIALREVWPGLTSIYISRVAGPGASRSDPVCEFAGIVTDFAMSESGTTVLGMKSIDWYLTRRNIRIQAEYTNVQQTDLAARLVNLTSSVYAGKGGIPLVGDWAPSEYRRDRVYDYWRRKNIGEAIQDLTQVINGPDWELVHVRAADNTWLTRMLFRDYVGTDRGVLIRSDVEASAYSVSGDIENMANLVDAYGAGEDEDQLRELARNLYSIYPEFDATPVWNDVKLRSTLFDHAQGYLVANQEPAIVPTVTVPGLDVDPTELRVGDTISTDISYGGIRFAGQARVITIAWELGPESPETRTLELTPLDPASESMLLQQPLPVDCEDC